MRAAGPSLAAARNKLSKAGSAGEIPWAEMMAFGFGVLRLSASSFWGMTFPEFRTALRGHRGEIGLVDPIPRDAFAELMQRFPDIAAAPETPDFHS